MSRDVWQGWELEGEGQSDISNGIWLHRLISFARTGQQKSQDSRSVQEGWRGSTHAQRPPNSQTFPISYPNITYSPSRWYLEMWMQAETLVCNSQGLFFKEGKGAELWNDWLPGSRKGNSTHSKKQNLSLCRLAQPFSRSMLLCWPSWGKHTYSPLRGSTGHWRVPTSRETPAPRSRAAPRHPTWLTTRTSLQHSEKNVDNLSGKTVKFHWMLCHSCEKCAWETHKTEESV